MLETMVAKRPKMEQTPSYRDADGTLNPRTVQAELLRIKREVGEIRAAIVLSRRCKSVGVKDQTGGCPLLVFH